MCDVAQRKGIEWSVLAEIGEIWIELGGAFEK